MPSVAEAQSRAPRALLALSVAFGLLLGADHAPPASAAHHFWNLRSTVTSKGYQESWGNVTFTNQKTVALEEWLADVCGPEGQGDGYGLTIHPIINTPVITMLSPDYDNTAGCGNTVYYRQDAREVWWDGGPKDLVNVYFQMQLTDRGRRFGLVAVSVHGQPSACGKHLLSSWFPDGVVELGCHGCPK